MAYIAFDIQQVHKRDDNDDNEQDDRNVKKKKVENCTVEKLLHMISIRDVPLSCDWYT